VYFLLSLQQAVVEAVCNLEAQTDKMVALVAVLGGLLHRD
jgi:hypothetical protein